MGKGIRVRTTASGDEWIEPGSIFIVRKPDAYISDVSPHYKSYIKSGNYEGHSIDSVDINIPTDQKEKFVLLSAPSGQDVWVNGFLVTDRDDPSPINDHKQSKSILKFGPGPDSARQAIRETKEQLIKLWTDRGWPVNCLE